MSKVRTARRRAKCDLTPDVQKLGVYQGRMLKHAARIKTLHALGDQGVKPI